jgi:hypothetical protein
MAAASWENCRADFVFDGALVDLVAPGMGPAEWEAFWSAMRAGPFGVSRRRADPTAGIGRLGICRA